MAYANVINKQIFVGNGSNQVFAYAQNTPLEVDVKVSILNTAGFETELTNVTHFDLLDVGKEVGGITVTYPRTSTPPIDGFDIPLSATEKLVVHLDPAHDQNFAKKHSSTLSPGQLEAKFDKHMRLIQTLFDLADRSFKVAIGLPGPPDSLSNSLLRWALLDETTVNNAAKLTVISEGWDATYNTVELELSVVAHSAAALDIQPLDTLLATQTNLESNVTTHIGSRMSGSDNANWQTSPTYTLGTGGDDYLTGTARFYSYNGGYLNGQAEWNYRSAAVHYSAACAMARHTSAIASNDGFDILMSTGNVTGTARLYGLIAE